MGIISLKTIKLNNPPASKEEAIQLAGELLVNAGHVAPAYVDGMQAREQSMSTYIGNGVAIPHGQFEDREIIYSTGISVAQFPDGIQWGEEEDEVAYLVLGIAATSDEHIGVLSNLADVLEEEEDAAALVKTNDPNFIIEQLGRAPAEEED
jgi:mannitol/fructose-specific phosphotransferase system IIA component